MFAYCLNNPINYVDYTGGLAVEIPTVMIVAVAVGVVLTAHFAAKAVVTFVDWVAKQWRSPFKQIEIKKTESDPPDVTYPGDDPQEAPDGTQWKGKGEQGSNQGNYHNPETGESWHPDLDHPEPIGPHWDYRDPSGNWWRVYPDNRFTFK